MRRSVRSLQALLVVAALALPALAAGRSGAGGEAPRPASPRDRDGDGLPDRWEREGVTLDGGAGPRFVDLPAMGADPTRPDVFLQIDWMADAEHDQRPDPEALRRVVEAFAASPYRSPTGSVGIALHVDAGPDSRLSIGGGRWGDLGRARPVPWQDQLGSYATGAYDWSAFERLKTVPGGFADTGRGAVFHYAVFGHYHDRDSPSGSGASGISRGVGGTDLLITLGNFTRGVGSVQEQAGTLMHELGHNLGLRHGGCDDTNFKEGYASVMNYAFQMDGLVRGGRRGVLDFSRGVPPVLDEALAPPTVPLVADAASRAGEARTCVGRGEARAGMAARTAPRVGGGSGRAPDACADGSAIDDWARLRLAVGAIGRPRLAPRRARD
jgi:hypothetical protein